MESRVLASGGRYTRTISAFLLTTWSMKPGSWWEKPLWSWRRPIASLNYLLTSHVWRQDHNGFSHQDPGFIDHVVNKKAEIVRVYLPPDANTLLSTYDHCLRSRNYVNVVVAGKQPAPVYLSMDQAIAHCTRGLGIWEWAGTEVRGE